MARFCEIALVALLVAPLAALEHPGAGARYLHGPHPKRDVIWIRTPEASHRLVAAISYERDFGKPHRGKVSGYCRLYGQDGVLRWSKRLNRAKVRSFRADQDTWLRGDVEEGELLECSVRMSGMPAAVPEGGIATLVVGLSDLLDEAQSPWVRIRSISPDPGEIRPDDWITVVVDYENPTSREVSPWVGVIESGTGYSPAMAIASDHIPPSIMPGAQMTITHKFRAAASSSRCHWTIDRVQAGLESSGRLFDVFDGLEIKSTKLHSFDLDRCQ